MRISYLLAEFGHTGGNMVLYNFMDKLCERGYEVFAITPTERVQWKPGFSHIVIERFSRSNSNRPRALLYDLGKKLVKKSPLLEKPARALLKSFPLIQVNRWRKK